MGFFDDYLEYWIRKIIWIKWCILIEYAGAPYSRTKIYAAHVSRGSSSIYLSISSFWKHRFPFLVFIFRLISVFVRCAKLNWPGWRTVWFCAHANKSCRKWNYLATAAYTITYRESLHRLSWRISFDGLLRKTNDAHARYVLSLSRLNDAWSRQCRILSEMCVLPRSYI